VALIPSATAELDLRAHGPFATRDRDRNLPTLRRPSLLRLRDPADSQLASPQQGRQRRRAEHAVDLLRQVPRFDPDRVEVDVFAVANAVEEVAKVRAAFQHITSLVKADLQDLEEGQVEELDHLCVAQPGHPR
jgi:hypothetical protein